MSERTGGKATVEIDIKARAGVPVIRIVGEIDHDTSELLDEAIWKARSVSPRIVLDLAATTYMDSGALSVILSHVRALRSKGWLGAAGANENVERLFRLVGLAVDPSFRLFLDLSSACAAAVKTDLADQNHWCVSQ